MGFYLGKSLRAGPFRFNMSPRGLGVSAGVPGFRVGTGPRGNYVRVGAGGVYYRASLGGGRRAVPAARPMPQPQAVPRPSSVVLSDVTGASAEDLVPTGPGDLVAQLNQASQRVPLAPLVFIVALVALWLLPAPLGVVLLVIGLVATVWLALRDRARRSVVAFYEVDDHNAVWFQALVDRFEEMGRMSNLWRINASGDVKTTYAYKTNAGASSIERRERATATLRAPRLLVTNIAVPSVAAGSASLHFLPDRLLVRNGRTYTDVAYDELSVSAHAVRFIESERVPRDGTQVDTTWQYVNVKGGPDRRFNNNRQLPVMQYGRTTLHSLGGLQWILDASRSDVGRAAAEVIDRAVAPRVLSADSS